MKLSQIQEYRLIHPIENHDGNGSWGIYLNPQQPENVIKLFYDEKQFNCEKAGYDTVLGEPSLIQYANPYDEITIQLDTSEFPDNRRCKPFNRALIIPFLSNPPWELIGSLERQETEGKLIEMSVNTEILKNDMYRVGLAPLEPTFFVHSVSGEIKAIDFTYCETIYMNYNETENEE